MGLRGPHAPSLEERLWLRVDTEPGQGPNGDCHEWTGCKNQFGYGMIGNGKGKVEITSRVAWRLLHGPIPVGMLICHKCDNPPCVRDEHLFLGTRKDNIDDAVNKGRLIPRGIVLLAKTHCKLGHPYSGRNLGVHSNGTRACRACAREKTRRFMVSTASRRELFKRLLEAIGERELRNILQRYEGDGKPSRHQTQTQRAG